jgi:hypothetical protein
MSVPSVPVVLESLQHVSICTIVASPVLTIYRPSEINLRLVLHSRFILNVHYGVQRERDLFYDTLILCNAVSNLVVNALVLESHGLAEVALTLSIVNFNILLDSALRLLVIRDV